jgi:hypothetical protein
MKLKNLKQNSCFLLFASIIFLTMKLINIKALKNNNIFQNLNNSKLVFSIELFRHGARNALLSDKYGNLTRTGKI